METQERQLVLDQLTASEARLLKLVDGLTPEQWNFRESPDRWSIAGNLEHLAVLETFIRAMVEKRLAGPPEPEKRAQAAANEPRVLQLAQSRSTRLNARTALVPTGRWPNPADLIAEFCNTRAQTVAFAAQTEASLRDHFFTHIAFGDLDCYQWLVLLAQHTERHVLQIEQIKADPNYPAS
jgi:DinB superfamily